jgi:hypothetical protein
MDIEIGSNLYRNADGTVEVEGVPQIALTLKGATGPLLVNFVQFDQVGRITAKIVDSSMAFNERRAHELSTSPTGVLLKNLELGKVVLHVELKEGGRVSFRQGNILTVKGHLLEISPTEWRIEKHRLSGQESDLQGKSVSIG